MQHQTIWFNKFSNQFPPWKSMPQPDRIQSVNQVRQRLLEFLCAHQVLTLAVGETDGKPCAAALFYAVDEDLRFYVLTDPGTRHGRALLANTAVAGTIQRDRQSWQEITGVQFRGRCRLLTGDERDRAWQVYTARFPFLLTDKFTPALAKTELWCLEPEWMRLIDNRLGFGHKEEWKRESG
jgi:uncharacterized protein